MTGRIAKRRIAKRMNPEWVTITPGPLLVLPLANRCRSLTAQHNPTRDPHTENRCKPLRWSANTQHKPCAYFLGRTVDKSTSDYICNTGTRGGSIFVTLVTSTPQQMYVILRMYQYLYVSELQIFSRLSMHNIKITAAPQPTHSKPPAIFKLL